MLEKIGQFIKNVGYNNLKESLSTFFRDLLLKNSQHIKLVFLKILMEIYEN